MKFVKWLQKVMQKKSGMLAVLILIWAAVGLLIGLVFGRILWMLQLMQY